jgi:uncharacterized transporter YbjL
MRFPQIVVCETSGMVGAAHAGRLLIERVRREGELREADPGTPIHPGDVLAMAGDHDKLFPLLKAIGEEVDDLAIRRTPRLKRVVEVSNTLQLRGRSAPFPPSNRVLGTFLLPQEVSEI